MCCFSRDRGVQRRRRRWAGGCGCPVVQVNALLSHAHVSSRVCVVLHALPSIHLLSAFGLVSQCMHINGRCLCLLSAWPLGITNHILAQTLHGLSLPALGPIDKFKEIKTFRVRSV